MKLRKLNARGFSHEIILVFIVLAVAVGGTYYLVASHADTPSCGMSNPVSGGSSTGSENKCTPVSAPVSSPVSAPTTSYQQYFTISTSQVNTTLSRANPDIALMKKDHAGYTQGFLYGPGFTINNISAGGYELYATAPTQGVGFYESSAGMTAVRSYIIHTYVNPSKPNGVYTGSYIVKYYIPSSGQWVDGPVVRYQIIVRNTFVYENFLTVKPYSVSVTLKRSSATAGNLIMGQGISITGVQNTSYLLYAQGEGEQGVGFNETSGGLGAGETDQVSTYINPNKPNGTYTGNYTLFYQTPDEIYHKGPTINFTIKLIN